MWHRRVAGRGRRFAGASTGSTMAAVNHRGKVIALSTASVGGVAPRIDPP